jgi:molybdopterin molybdotransferase
VLSVDDARAAVLAATPRLGLEQLALGVALRGRVLGAPVVSLTAVPPFDNSAMDGFAIQAGAAERRLRIVDESRAGTPASATVEDGTAIRISTGAQLPDGATAVVMIERTTEHADASVSVHADTVAGQNVRRAGEDIRAGQAVLKPGSVLGPAELGVAANAGAATLTVAQRPRVAVLTTGDELVAVGRALGRGQIHNSNGVTLAALAADAGAEVVVVDHAPDDQAATEQLIGAALARADLLLLTGGVSVGPHDHVKPALTAQGVDEHFWRVALRPGKPTWFGSRGETLVLGLPGNPVSTVVTFLLFARPALAAMQGADPSQPHITARLGQDVTPTEGREELIRVQLDGDLATPTGPQGSHVLTSLLGADGLARIPAGDAVLPAGSTVDVLVL